MLVRQLDEVGELKSPTFLVPIWMGAVMTYERNFFEQFLEFLAAG